MIRFGGGPTQGAQTLARGFLLAQNATVNLASITTPNDGVNRLYQVGGYINTTAWTNGNQQLKVTFTDPNNVVFNNQTISMLTGGGFVQSSGAVQLCLGLSVTVLAKPNTVLTVLVGVTGVNVGDFGGWITLI